MHAGQALGEGAFGTVVRASWMGIDVAVKMLKAADFPPEMLQMFEAEAALHAGLRHLHIVSVYCFVTDHKPPCVVMELLDRSLFALLRSREALPWPERERIAREISAGLLYLHKHDILHRDLKSPNVLLTGAKLAKLSDFGLSKIKSEVKTSLTVAGTSKPQTVGTIPFMAPELFKRKPEYSRASDMYAYAHTLWELASRTTPFKDAPDAQLIIRWVGEGEREEVPEDAPVHFRAVIETCWDQVPAKRLTIEAALKALEDRLLQPAAAGATALMDSFAPASFM